MKRNIYQKPTMIVVQMRQQSALLLASDRKGQPTVKNYDWHEVSEE